MDFNIVAHMGNGCYAFQCYRYNLHFVYIRSNLLKLFHLGSYYSGIKPRHQYDMHSVASFGKRETVMGLLGK